MKFFGRLIVILFIALISTHAFGQKTRATKVTDSLQSRMVNASNLDDSLEVVFYASERYIDLIPDYMAKLLTKLSYSSAKFSTTNQLKYAMAQGKLSIVQNRFNDALHFFNEAQALAKNNDLQEEEQNAQFSLAEALFIKGNSDDAKSILLNLLASKSLSKANTVRSYLVLGKIYYFQGQIAQTLNYCNNGLKAYGEGCKLELQLELFLLKSNAYIEKGNFVEAIRVLLEAKKITEKRGVLNYQSEVYNSIGIIYLTVGRPKQAIVWFEQALILCEELQTDAKLADIYNNLGSSWLNLRDLPKAKAYYLKAQGIWASVQDTIGMSIAYNNMAELFMRSGDFVEATKNVVKSIGFDELLNDNLGLMESYQTAGEIEYAQGNHQQALLYLNKAYRLSNQNNSVINQIKIAKTLSKSYEAVGAFNQALQFYKLYQSKQQLYLNDSIVQIIETLVAKNSKAYALVDSKVNVADVAATSPADQLKALLRRLQVLTYLLILFAIFSAIAFFYWFRFQKRAETVQSELLECQNQFKSADEASKVAIAKANDAYKQQENFLHCMTHELRTPLNGIIGFASILEEEISDDYLRTMAHNITQSGNRLLATVNGLLDLSAFEDNKLEIEQSNFNLKDLLFQCVEKWRQEARIKGLAIDFYTELNELWVNSDYILLDKVVSYLTDNAIKYTSQGYVKVKMNVRFSKGQQWAVIKVIDSGIGIPEDQIDLVFANFRQASEGYTRQYEGPGIGLSLSRSLITILGGYIEVESRVGIGSTFSVFIPATQQQETDKPVHSAFINRMITNDKKPLLLVEDDETNREFATYALSKHFNIDLATNGKMALRLASQKQYSLILMDINLGRQMSGTEVVAILRAKPEYALVPIAAITANTRADHRDDLLTSGFTHFLAKPYTKVELKSLVSKMLGSNPFA